MQFFRNVLPIFVSALLPFVHSIADEVPGELPFRSLDSAAAASMGDLDDKLIRAILDGNVKGVVALIAEGANGNAGVDGNFNARAEDKYMTVLMLAAKRGNADIVKALIASGANVDGVYNFFATTALMLAAEQDNAVIVHVLIAAGANIEATNFYGRNALMVTASGRYPRSDKDNTIHAVRALIAAGANVNATDLDGRTALMMAAEYNNLNTVRALIAAGADVNVTDHAGKTALEWVPDRYDAGTVYSILNALRTK